MMTLAEACDVLNRNKPAKPPYYMEILHPEDGAADADEAIGIYEPDLATLILLRAQDIAAALADAKAI